MPYDFRYHRRIAFAETDMAGIMHFANFFRLMEEAEHAFFRSLGWSIHGHDPVTTTGWPRVNASCDFRAPLRFEDEVEVHLLVAEVRTRAIRYAFVFRKDGAEVARGSVTAVCASVEKATGRLAAVPIPDFMRGVLETAPANLLTNQP
jgi:YbgC/YbaW family acyl-CoA thioester hydrolase